MSESEIQPAPEQTSNVTPIDQPRRQPNANEMRQQKQFEERVRRTMNQFKLTQEQAIKKIQEDDWNDMPLDKKVKRMEALLGNLARQVGGDINTLRSNDAEIADAMDINLRAFTLMLEKLGITIEEQNKFLAQAKLEIQADQAAKAAAQEGATHQDEVSVEKFKNLSSPGTPTAPAEATEFGG